MLRMLTKLVVPSLVLAGVCWGGLQLFFTDWPTQGLLPKLGGLAVVISTGAAAFFLTATALGISELREITHAVKRKLLRRA